nr:hypothetical protein [Candidatus Saccharibacteria bacterium]NIV98960.1 hypothetical protein [Candidatus Saccharibacteria bacterium]NIW78652.1 hypothetical protein [Calditrichia bacterium]
MKRREFLKLTGLVSAGMMVPWTWKGIGSKRVYAVPAAAGLSDPALQPKFVNLAPNALHPDFKYTPSRGANFFDVGIAKRLDHLTGLVDSSGYQLQTPVWGYGQAGAVTWPGKTFEVWKDSPIQVRWANNLFGEPHLLPVDTNLHWSYSLHGYDQYT